MLRSTSRLVLFTSEADIFSALCSIPTNVDRPVYSFDLPAQSFFQAVKFPSFSSSEIKKITAAIENGQTFRQILLQFPFSFPFLPDRMSFLLKNLDKSCLSFTSLFILYSWLTWTTSFSHRDEVDVSLIAILDSLAQISDKTTFSSIRDHTTLSISIFLYLFSIALRMSPGPFVK
jgi:hypothetical protein